MINTDKFKTPEAKALMTIGAITIATSFTLQLLPKTVSVAIVSVGAGLAATTYFAKNIESIKKTTI